MLWLWVLGAVIAVCGALTVGELSAALPRNGGDYVYLYEAYGPVAAFLSGWVSFLIGFAAPSAAAAFAASKFLLAPLGVPPSAELFAQRGLASAAILVFAAVHVSGRRRTAHLQGWVTAFTLVFLIVYIVAGLSVGWPRYAHFNDRPPVTYGLVRNMLFSLVYIMYGYVGWNSASYLAGEVVNPQKLLPRAILLGTAGVVVLYLGMNLVYGLALSAPDIVAIVNDPSNVLKTREEAVEPIAQLAAERLFGERWSSRLTILFGLTLLSTVNAYVLTGPRVIYAMAVSGQFPEFAGRLTARAGTPGIATALQVACALVFLWTGTFERIVVYASVGLAIFSMLSISSIYVLRWSRPDLPRPFRTPGYPLTPAVYLVLMGILSVASFCVKPWESLFALLSILAGIPIYYAWQSLRRTGGRATRANDQEVASAGSR
jgi:APA family basic amino acid/polyamine antiporter